MTSDPQTVLIGIKNADALIAAPASRHLSVPHFPNGGGLMSYGVDLVEMYRRLVPFVAKVAERRHHSDRAAVEVRAGINLKTAKMLGLTVPLTFLLSADEVIE